MIATKTSIDVSSVKIPDTVTDDLFKKKNNLPEGAEKKDGVFADNKKTKEKWVPSEERKKIQKEVESQVTKILYAANESKLLQ